MASFNIKSIKTVVAISSKVVAYVLPFQYKGKVSDVIPLDNSKKTAAADGDFWRYAVPAFSTDYKPPVSKYSAFTPVEDISCPVLLVCGTGDLNVDPDPA